MRKNKPDYKHPPKKKPRTAGPAAPSGDGAPIVTADCEVVSDAIPSVATGDPPGVRDAASEDSSPVCGPAVDAKPHRTPAGCPVGVADPRHTGPRPRRRRFCRAARRPVACVR